MHCRRLAACTRRPITFSIGLRTCFHRADRSIKIRNLHGNNNRENNSSEFMQDHLYVNVPTLCPRMPVGWFNKSLLLPLNPEEIMSLCSHLRNRKRNLFFTKIASVPRVDAEDGSCPHGLVHAVYIRCEEKARRGKTWRSGRSRHVLRVLSVRSLPSDRLNKVHYLMIAGRTKDAVKSRRVFIRLFGIFSVRTFLLTYSRGSRGERERTLKSRRNETT